MKPLLITELNEHTTKIELASLLAICVRSVYSYHAIALECLPEYSEDYPAAGGKPITRYPLTRYQCWVLAKIAWHLRIVFVQELKSLLTEHYAFSCQFSKEEFERLYSQPTTLATFV